MKNFALHAWSRLCASCVLLLCMAAVAAPRAAAQADPMAFISQLGNQAIQVMGPSVPAAQRLARFRELYAANFDVAGIGQFVLGRYWSSATPQEQQEFLRLFREYVVQALSARTNPYAGEPFRVLGAQQSGNQIVVTSEVIRLDNSKVPIDWYLISSGGFKITDVYVQSISMKVTQRDEFAAVLQQGGGQVRYLLDRIRAKIATGG
jgi:phospholipid transport system substrate-binding protein